jgi:prefoldin alpha subunit
MTEDQRQVLQKIYVEQKLTESNVGLLQQRLELVQAYLSNYQTGLQVLQELENKKQDEEVLLNVGGSIFVKAKLSDVGIVTRGIGSGARIEQSVAEAKEGVKEAIASLEKQYENLSKEYEKVTAYLNSLNTQFQQLAAQIQDKGE